MNMHIQINRPFDFLDSLKGQKVVVHCKGYKDFLIEGLLHAFDMNINLVLETIENKKGIIKFIRGDNVLFIEEVKHG